MSERSYADLTDYDREHAEVFARNYFHAAEAEIERLREDLVATKTDLHNAYAEIERLKAGLRRIADANSGGWGWIAHDTLHPDRARGGG